MQQKMFLLNRDRAATLLETTNVKQHFGSYKGDDGSLCAYAMLIENKIHLPDTTMGHIIRLNDGLKWSPKEIAKWLRTATEMELLLPLPLQATVKGADV